MLDIFSFLILIGLLVVGVLIIIFIAKVIWFFLPAGIVALIVFILTGDLMWTGVSFLAVAFISLLKKIFWSRSYSKLDKTLQQFMH